MQYHHRAGSSSPHPAGDSRTPPLRVDFDPRPTLEFHGGTRTSDAGLLAYRELDEVLGLTDPGGAALSDSRRGKNTRHLLTGLPRQSDHGRLAGYRAKNWDKPFRALTTSPQAPQQRQKHNITRILVA